MHMVVRSWTNAGAVADALESRQQEVHDLISGVPGFVAYYGTRAGDGLTTVTVCDSEAGTQESTRLAREWVQKNVTGASIGPPQITEGETFIQF